MKFWDTSAIVPLCCQQPSSQLIDPLLKADDDLVVWWATPIECSSALARLQRDRSLTPQDVANAQAILSRLQHDWTEVFPAEVIRVQAIRMLRLHELRAADALQLGSALIWAQLRPQGYELISLDKRLRAAAVGEGFSVLP